MLATNTTSQFTHPYLLHQGLQSVSFENLPTEENRPDPASLDPDRIVDLLMQGNQQFARMRSEGINHSSVRLSAVAQGQKPFAAVLNYAQLSTSTEEIFSQKFGDLFVINAPGHITNYQDISSIEYGVLILGIKTVIILADARYCQPEAQTSLDRQSGGCNVDRVKLSIHNNKILLSRSTTTDPKGNILSQAAKLKASPLLRQFVRNRELAIVTGLYDEDTGLVNLLT
jgi:carbonic anhydrase